jgi:hypothetical protein
MRSQFAAQANITRNDYYSVISTQDVASNTYLQASADDTLDSTDYASTWSDPTDDMISMAHELTLRTAIATANTLVVVQGDPDSHGVWGDFAVKNTADWLTAGQSEIALPNLTFVNRTTSQEAAVTMNFGETVYKTQPGWLAAAFAVILLACFSIVPTYWGWWRLGRPVSMSPLEIAKAFDARLMRHADSNGTVDDHLRSVGGMRVRYGSHATAVEELESDTAERLSYRPKFDETVDNSAGEKGSSNDVGPNGYSAEHVVSSKTSIVGPAKPDDDVESRMLHPETSPASDVRLDPGTTIRSLAPSDPSGSDPPEMQADSSSGRALGTRPASSRTHTRTEMRLRFAEE